MTKFISTIKYTIWLLLCSIAIIACADDDLKNIESDNQHSPIQLFASGPDGGVSSRAIKNTFVDGDGIHISTVFKLDNNDTKTVYSFIKYKSGQWVEENTTTFNWPWNAVSASFTAYYIPTVTNYANGNKLNNNGTVNMPLSELSLSDVEPLKATLTDVQAGSSVYLQFDHMFSKVTFTQINQARNDNVTPGEELRFMVPGSSNVMRITLSGSTLKEEFITDANDYIANNSTKPESGIVTDVTFIIPAVNQTAKMKLARRDMSTLHFINLPDNLTNGLEVGKHYKIDVNKLLDNYIAGDITESEWNENIDVIKLTAFEIGAYLKGVSEGSKYSVIKNGKEIHILTTYTDNSGKLIVSQVRDVDFDYQEFISPKIISSNVTFNGNNHYIKNVFLKNTAADENNDLNKAIFASNKGKLSNLIIENVKTEDSPTTKETRLGTLIGTNESEGELNNIQIKGSVTLVTGTSIIYAGSLIGTNYGSLTNCSVKATSLTINTVNNSNASTVNIGGLVGYSSGDGKFIENCHIEVGASSSITVSGTSDRKIFIGGFVGQSMGVTINNSRTNLPLNIQKTTHLTVGGFVGITTASLEGCTSIGSIICQGNTSLTEVAIGGFIGTLNGATLTDCSAISSITGTFNDGAYVGGLVGNIEIEKSNSAIKYSSATGKLADKAAGVIGAFQVKNGYNATIDNSFCINGNVFSNSALVTISECHINGKEPATGNNFTPVDKTYWTNTPPIYGTGIYYLKRGFKN